MEIYLVCFDISDDDRRRRIGNLLLGYGERVQRSVFEISVRGGEELTELRNALDDHLAPDDRDIRFYRLCASCRSASQTLDGERIARLPAVLIV
ncbi:MAG: CRISPR-associated endonuclease Cas2 [Thiohalocapsa sp. PB-PSB1]|jgi:CRISPR-associated protein Cas2|nr:MAG: hypothetical protein N838_03345 [Thiohalocapsa sp. PB-PSB1]QQO54445.1 MAG: CRISPR-associated endonuclease Cas2 [Thiohalocapsa sp. PB-PSB1]